MQGIIGFDGGKQVIMKLDLVRLVVMGRSQGRLGIINLDWGRQDIMRLGWDRLVVKSLQEGWASLT